MLTNLYVDGFNLYNRAVKHTPFKWLNLRGLAETLFPDDEIQRICFFTALVRSRSNDPTQTERQASYLRALATLPGLEIHFGEFRERIKSRPLARPRPDLPRYVRIRDTEEKGSDVNLATRLLVGGFTGDYQQAVVVSNDSDLGRPDPLREVTTWACASSWSTRMPPNQHPQRPRQVRYLRSAALEKPPAQNASFPQPSPTPTASSPSRLRGSRVTGRRFAG